MSIYPQERAVHEDWSSLQFRIYGTSYSDRMILYDDSWIVDADYEEYDTRQTPRAREQL